MIGMHNRFNRRVGYYPPVIDLRTEVTVDDKKGTPQQDFSADVPHKYYL